MQIVGDGNIHFYDPGEYLPHEFPADAEWWNESVWLNFVDDATGTYGTMRLGHQPNWNGGHAAIWTMIGTPSHVYKRDGLYPLSDSDRGPDGFAGNGTHRYRFDGKVVRWTINDGDLALDLRMTDFHQPFGFWPSWKNMAPNHLEAAGTVSGTITLKGEPFRIEAAPAYRDHSWGVRHWDILRSHRWVATTFGPELSCNVLALYDQHDTFSTYGYVRRGNTVYTCRDIDVVTYGEADGISHRGGEVRYTLPDGEIVEIQYRRINRCALSRQHRVVINDTACRAYHGAMIGGACFETTNNILAGTYLPPQKGLVGSIIVNGVWPAAGPFGD